MERHSQIQAKYLELGDKASINASRSKVLISFSDEYLKGLIVGQYRYEGKLILCLLSSITYYYYIYKVDKTRVIPKNISFKIEPLLLNNYRHKHLIYTMKNFY